MLFFCLWPRYKRYDIRAEGTEGSRCESYPDDDPAVRLDRHGTNLINKSASVVKPWFILDTIGHTRIVETAQDAEFVTVKNETQIRAKTALNACVGGS